MSRVKQKDDTLVLTPYFNETRKIRRARKGLGKLMGTLTDAGLSVNRTLFPSDDEMFTVEMERLESEIKKMGAVEIIYNAATIARLATK